MPPKAKITKEMIIDAAFEIARANGADKLNVRTVAGSLGCSTQPVMYHFGTVDELKAAVCQKADEYHTAYIMDTRSNNPMTDIGLNFIRFAREEKNLFALFPDTGIRVQKTQITFTNPKVFVCVSLAKVRKAEQRPKDYIVVTFGLGHPVTSPRIDAVSEPYPGRWTHHVTIGRPEEIDGELMRWAENACRFSKFK